MRYWPEHEFDEWMQNAADIDRARVVWALDLGAEENDKLRQYYPDRSRLAAGARCQTAAAGTVLEWVPASPHSKIPSKIGHTSDSRTVTRWRTLLR